MENSNSPNNDEDILRIYASDSKTLRIVSQLLATKKSNKIYNLCRNKSLSAKEIAKVIESTENPRLSIYSKHIKTMVKVGLLKVEERFQRKNGHHIKYYTSVQFIVIVPPERIEKANKSKDLRNAFSSIFKFAAIALIGIVGFEFLQPYIAVEKNWGTSPYINNDLIPTYFILPFVIIIASLIIDRIRIYYKNKD